MEVQFLHGSSSHHDNDDSDGEIDYLLWWKFILCVLIIASTVLGCVLPKVFLKLGNAGTVLCLCNSFAGGVVFGVALIHLLPEATEEWDELYPDMLPPIIMYSCCFGFMILIFVENLVVQQQSSTSHEHISVHEVCDEYSRLNEPLSKVKDEEEGQHHGDQTDIFTSYTLMCALCFHSVIEGFALGMLTELSDLILVFIAIISHKAVAAFALGTSMAKADMSTRRYIIMSAIFTLATPLGMGIAVLILVYVDPGQTAADTITLVTEGIASGTFLFIATMEIFAVEFRGGELFLPKLALAMLGIIIMALVSLYS